jgi:hypothetical protein
MGYSTEFRGELKIKNATLPMVKKLKTFLGQDIREHKEWINRTVPCEWSNNKQRELTYIDFELTEEMDGIRWDGAEKFYDAVEKVNFITANMKKDFPDFEFEGELLAQGEEFDDRWKLVMKNGIAYQQQIAIKGKVITCPHCEEKFELEE